MVSRNLALALSLGRLYLPIAGGRAATVRVTAGAVTRGKG